MFYVFSRTGSQFESFSTLISTLSLQAAAVSTKLLPFTHVVHVQCADRLTALTSSVTHWLTPQGSHLYVMRRSVCDWDQNWIQRSKSLFGGRSKDQGDLGTAKTQEPTMHGCNLTLTLGNQAIKSLRRERSSDQAFFCWSKNLIAVANASTGDI